MSDLFLDKVKVRNCLDAMSNALKASLARNLTYTGASNRQKEAFRDKWAKMAREVAVKYIKEKVGDDDHCANIAKISDALSSEFADILIGKRLRFGASQKALNLYLKFLWRLGQLDWIPPHCPLDSIVLKAAGIKGAWTKCDSTEEYMKWVEALRNFAKPQTLSDWEYELWNKSA